jgi:anti-anti-sigma factor
MSSNREILDVYAAGRLTVVGFGGYDVLDHVNVDDLRAEIEILLSGGKCEALAFDLTGVTFVPSGLLGLLASLKDHNIQVLVFNPSEDIREVLEITRLDQIMQVHDTDRP